MGSIFGSAPAAPDPFSARAVAFRREEREAIEKENREREARAREMALEDREWQEDLEERRATRKQKEEEERIRLLRQEQQQATETVEAMTENFGGDVDQRFGNMWSSLSSGVGQARSNRSRNVSDAYSRFLTGGS
tara:strand:+ start:945 stop:1349 length:405 start_codon:yes stop_codon:yes gene_type:complete